MNRKTKAPVRLPRPALAAVLFAVFVVALGFGVVLPVLPLMVGRLLASPDAAGIARHTALLTGAFAVAPLAAALPWGRLSDRHGRRLILVLGLAGFALTLAASALALDLPALYAARLLNGGFAAAVLPTALALVADTELDETRRARTFGWVNVAYSLGLLAGPMLGGFASDWGATMFGGAAASLGEVLPFILVAGATVAAAFAVWSAIPGGPPPERPSAGLTTVLTSARPGEISLLALAAVAAGGLGAFEVGLTLQSRALAMAPATLGLMFAACMVVMLVVQAVAFSPLIKPATTRWFIAPSFAVMGLGLALIPTATGSDGLLASTGMVAASGGLLAPILAYWVSRISGRGQGTELGLQTAAVSLGQAVGAIGPGLLPKPSHVFDAASLVPTVIAAIAVVASLRLTSLLALGRTPSGETAALSRGN